MIPFSMIQRLSNAFVKPPFLTCSRRFLNNNAIQTNLESSTQVAEKDLPDLNKNPYEKEKRKCILCKLNIEPDYKNVRLLSQFQSRYTGRIYGRHITGLCEHKQKKVEEEIIKAQTAGLMGHYTKDPKFVLDPKLFDPNNPFRPHKY